MFANAFTHAAAKNAREVHGMDTSFACELVEGEPAAMFSPEFVQNAGEPAWGVPAFALERAAGAREQFGKQAFDGELIKGAEGLYFAEELHTEPEQRAADDVVPGSVQSGGAIGEALSPGGADLDLVKANAARPDFVLMGNARGPEHNAERSVLALVAAVAFTIQTVEHEGEKGEFVRMHGELAGSGMAQIGENGATVFAFALNCAEEAACAHVLGGGRAGNS
ncbi:MAG TPA: hypothetical protein VF748_11165 [Candidatus Acidoferrum sp.]